MNETPDSDELLQKLDEMVELLEAHHQKKSPVIRPQFDAVVEGLKKERSLLAAEFAKQKAATDEVLANINKARALAQSELQAAKDAASKPKVPKPPAAMPAKPASIDPNLGARLRQELLIYLGNKEPAPATTLSPASFTRWAMASSSLDVLAQAQTPAVASFRLGPVISGLSDRRAIWWGCIAVAEAMRMGNRQLPPDELSALEAATRWVLTPSPAAKEEMSKMADNLKDQSIGRALGQAVAVADPDAPGKSATGCVLAAECAAEALLPESQRPAYASRCKEIAAAVAEGRAMWPNVVASPEKKPSGDFQAWLSQSAR